MKTIISLILTAALFTACATNPDGSLKPLTDAQRANLQALEQFALSTAVTVGTQAIATGTVDTNTIVGSINSGAQVLQTVIANQAPVTAAETKTTAQNAISDSSATPVVADKIAPKVSQKIADTVASGVPPNQAANAAAKGLRKGAAKIKAKQP